MTQPRTRRTAVTTALTAVITAAALTIGALLLFPFQQGHPRPGLTEGYPAKGSVGAALRAAMPDQNPVLAITTPPGDTWWAWVASLTPTLGLTDATLTPCRITTVGYGYAHHQPRTRKTAPVYAATYVQTETAEAAAALATCLNRQPGHERRHAYPTGTTVIIGPEWADRTEFNLKPGATSNPEGARTAGEKDRYATWTWDVGRWATLITDRAHNIKTRTTLTDLTAALGITADTTLVATANDPSSAWLGAATNHHTNTASPRRIETALLSTAETIATTITGTQESSTGRVVDPHLADLLSTTTFTLTRNGNTIERVGNGTAHHGNLDQPLGTTIAGALDLAVLTNYALGYQVERLMPPAAFEIDSTGNAALRIATRDTP